MAIYVIIAIVAVAVTLLIAVPVTANISVKKKTEKDAETIGTAEVKARSIIDEALKTAETKKREALLEAKEENLRTKNELEKETKERRNELQKYEKRVLSKEEALDKKADVLEKREAEYAAKEADLKKKEKKVDELQGQRIQELEKMTTEPRYRIQAFSLLMMIYTGQRKSNVLSMDYSEIWNNIVDGTVYFFNYLDPAQDRDEFMRHDIRPYVNVHDL